MSRLRATNRPEPAQACRAWLIIFESDADTLPDVMAAVQQTYDGSVDYAQDIMVWNITKNGVRTRMAVPNREAYPTPPLGERAPALAEKQPDCSGAVSTSLCIN